jgi:CheY-like chemotaxis protein
LISRAPPVARVRLIHWNGPDGRECRRRLAALGHEALFDELDGSKLLRAIRAEPVDAVVIDLSRLPSHGREAAMALRRSKSTRHLPLVFVDGDPAKVAAIKAWLPDATYASWPRLGPAVARALARPAKTPVVPPSSVYAGKPTVEKLGVKPGLRVAVLNAPPNIESLLAPLPTGVTLTAKGSAEADLFLGFVRSRQDLDARVITLARLLTRQTAWLIWPKTSSGVRTDLTGNIVRETGLAAGLVDYKVCSLDETWSGLAFKRRG